MVLPPRTRKSGDGRRNRVTIRVKNEIDGMIYTLVFEGSLEKLFVRQLKRHIQDTAGVLVSNQQLMMGRAELVDDKLCSEYGMRDGQILTLVAAREAEIPKAGIQPQQLPPPGAVFPPPPPPRIFDNQTRGQMHSDFIPSPPMPQQIQPPPPSQLMDEHIIPQQPIHDLHPSNIIHHQEYEQPVPPLPSHLEYQANTVEPLPPSYDDGHHHHHHQHQREATQSDQLIEKLRENNERLRSLQRNEAELHNREMELSSQERIFRKNYEDAQTSRLTEAQLRHHQDTHTAAYVDDYDEEGSVIIGIEELPPSPTHRLQYDRRRSEEKRISPLRHRRSIPTSSCSFQYGPTRSKSAAEQTAQSTRSFEMESNWKSSCTKFDLQRSHNATQMDKMQQQLLERQAELEKLSRGMEQDIQHTNAKRRIVEELKLKCAFG
eukprot:TRINITY_DN5813_c0_g1_i2.p1 TRINITY_DN5813_c0_g1~~TRINITY_DN5813_c0_g1_i2.p1  ORF type:complete len:432 (+),score=102.89 TRINITY_DN5813_c0_g1_i2:99-1394(+)